MRMCHSRAARLLRLSGLGLLLTLPMCAPAAAPERGVVVESVLPHAAGATAGLRPGDLILAWSGTAAPADARPAGGEIHTPYDLLPLEVELAPRRPVILHGRRGEAERTWTLAASGWGVESRPVLPAGLAERQLTAQAQAAAGDLAAAGRAWRAAAKAAEATGDRRQAAWFLDRLASALADDGRGREADAAFQQAAALLEHDPDPAAAADLLCRWGDELLDRDAPGARDAAFARYRQALRRERAAAARSLGVARALDDLGVALAKGSDFPAAEAHLRQALAIRRELAPGTTEIAGSLNKLGILARLRGDLAAAEQLLARGEALQRRLAPGSPRHGLLLLNAGNVAADRGDLEGAERLQRQALAIAERINPSAIAGNLENLANVAMARGDLAAADDLLHRRLALLGGRARNVAGTWRALIGLGNLAALRGDLEAAAVHYRRSLALAERHFPAGRELAISLTSLGDVALERGDFTAARPLLERARRIVEELAPGTAYVAEALLHLARLEAESGGDLAAAEAFLRQALAILEQVAPESQETATALRSLGEIAARRGRLSAALTLHGRALAHQRRLAPGSTEEAAALHFLGRTERRAGRQREGIGHLCQAVDALDRQRSRLGGTPEERTAFEATLGDYFHACLEGRIESGQPAAAFHVLERGRARSFLALLAQRDLRLSGQPPQLAAERRRVDADYDRIQARLAGLSADRDGAESERLTGTLRDLHRRQLELAARLRRESPRTAALADPAPLDLAGARAALDPGTVLLAYAVGAERTWLFVVAPTDSAGDGLSVVRIALGEPELRAKVEGFRRLLADPGSDPAEIRARGERLYALLVRPAEAQVGRARRILVSADGPLHTLAFAALVRDGRYLGEWKPVHSTLSATVYAELAKARPPRRDPGALRLAAFGDPLYRRPAAGAADPMLREAVRRGWSWQPLRFSRREVTAIAALFPAARVYLGGDATEERARSLGRDSQLVHFACHGLLDERFPLNSGLALTLPERQAEGQANGLLQAWEIFESVRLDADLVTLSACDTALGREMGGEGLVGLTRAFQYAGARSVLASLWEVADLSTARFMTRFYRHLRSGRPKDEALQAAQIDQIREGTAFSHPFHWAAFQLTGDWR